LAGFGLQYGAERTTTIQAQARIAWPRSNRLLRRAYSRAPVNFDVNTLLALMLVNVFAMAIAVPAVMGWRVSPAARHVLGSAVAQALAWACFLLAKPVNDRLFSTLWIALLGTSFVLMWHALRRWLGPRPGRPVLLAAAVLTPLGYGLSFGSYPFRVGWSNFGLALLMGLVCLACVWPAPHASRRWRGLIVVCLGSLAGITLARGVLGAFFTELYPTLRTPHPINVIGAVLNHIALTLTTIGLLVGWHEEAEHELRNQADTDGLTGLLNRRAWRVRAASAMDYARRNGERIAVLMLDIDHFKRINDRWGHETGDRALQVVAKVLRDGARRGDLLCRYGGEEFCLLLAGIDEATARAVDERLRDALRSQAAVDTGFALDFSSGMAILRDDDADIQSMLRRADAALYEAKAAGRGRLIWFDERLAAQPRAA
jgi:diguanylate cyclase (GGDEF)-like protein